MEKIFECYLAHDITEAIQLIKAQLALQTDLGLTQNLALAEHMRGGSKITVDYFISLLNTSVDEEERSGSENAWDLSIANINATNGTLYFNLASILFHYHRFEECQRVLDVLFSLIDHYEESLLFKICFLALEVLLRLLRDVTSLQTDRPHIFQEKFRRIVDSIEKVNNTDIGGRPSLISLGCIHNESSSDLKQNSIFIRSLIIFRTHLYKCRCLMELSQLKQSKKEIKNALEIFQREIRHYIDPSTENSKVFTYSIGKLYFGCPITPIDCQNQFALYIKANLEYFRKNYKKAVKLLISCRRKDAEDDGAIFNNNIGCIYFRLQRFDGAALYFQNAVTIVAPERDMQCFRHSYMLDILYNRGLSLLLSEQYVEAFACFMKCSQAFATRPHLWVRMAECCLGHSRNLRDESSSSFLLTPVSEKYSKRLAIVRKWTNETGELLQPETTSDLCLVRAKLYLMKSLDLLNQISSGSVNSAPTDVKLDEGKGDIAFSQFEKDESEAASEEVTTLRPETVAESAMLLLAFVYLELSDPIQSLTLSTQLLTRNTLSERNRFLVGLYHTESLCLTGRLQDAKSFLEYTFTQQETLQLSSSYLYSVFGSVDLSGVDVIRVIVLINRAVKFVHSDMLVEAQSNLEAVLEIVPRCPIAIKTLLYILLKSGQSAAALHVVRGYRQ